MGIDAVASVAPSVCMAFYTETMKKPRLSRLEEQKLKKRLARQDYAKLYLILTEGTKTEPYYFEGFKKAVESCHPEILVEIIGVGKATTKLLEFADEFIEEFSVHNAELWLVTDKDDFQADHFNKLVSECLRRDKVKFLGNWWHAAWSNECFELWFVLHFSFYQAAATRTEYYKILKEQFRKHRLGSWKKNDPEIFRIMTCKGNPRLAIHYAKKLHKEKQGQIPSSVRPCTTVYALVEELARYLPADLKQRFFG